MDLSVIIPVYNEEENIPKLHTELTGVLAALHTSHEVIYVNDGSKDKSLVMLRTLASSDTSVTVISFARNFGQTAALAAGIHFSHGDILVFLDSDLQNDPHDIPLLLDKIHEGYDVVSGGRKERKDRVITRRIPSMLANKLIAKITRVPLHDFGCTLKAYTRRVIENVELYGEMHRFIPAYAAWYGARVAEVVVNHRPRMFGASKYGLGRTLKVILDLLFVKFWHTYRSRPMHFFGGVGLVCILAAFISGVVAVVLRLTAHISFIETPLPLFTVFATIAGLQFVLIGVVAEMLVRVYFGTTQRSSSFIVQEVIPPRSALK